MTNPTPPTAAPAAAQATVERKRRDLIEKIAADPSAALQALMEFDAEIQRLRSELAPLHEAPLPEDVEALAQELVTAVWTATRDEAVERVCRLVLADRQRAVEALQMALDEIGRLGMSCWMDMQERLQDAEHQRAFKVLGQIVAIASSAIGASARSASATEGE